MLRPVIFGQKYHLKTTTKPKEQCTARETDYHYNNKNPTNSERIVKQTITTTTKPKE